MNQIKDTKERVSSCRRGPRSRSGSSKTQAGVQTPTKKTLSKAAIRKLVKDWDHVT